MEQLNDDQLIYRAVAGDGAALATLFQGYEPVLMRYAERRLSSRVRLTASPEDVVQETCYEATRLIAGFVPSGHPNAFLRWLLRIAHYRVKDVVNKHRSRAKHWGAGGGDEDSAVISAIEELAVYRRTPSRSAAAHEFMAAVERSLDKLPEQYREVVTLRHLQGLSVEETAERMGRDRAAVSVLSSRALAALRERLRSESRYV